MRDALLSSTLSGSINENIESASEARRRTGTTLVIELFETSEGHGGRSTSEVLGGELAKVFGACLKGQRRQRKGQVENSTNAIPSLQKPATRP
jgi:hypothetical protein